MGRRAIMPTTDSPPPTELALGPGGLPYLGGPIMPANVKVYYIFYGNWSSTDRTILTDFAANIAPSPYYRINTTYFDSTGARVANSISFLGSINDNYSLGTSLTDANIRTIVANAITTGALPSNPNAVYFVLTSPDVSETGGFCSSFCGWHTSTIINGVDIKFSFVGNPLTLCPAGCGVQTVSPNSSPGADAVANIVAHELEEATTDPDINAWRDDFFTENADKCVWTFGSTYTTPNGAAANMRLGARDFRIQQNWVNNSGGYCSLRLRATNDLNASFRSDIALTSGNGWNTVPVAFSNGDGTFQVTNQTVPDFAALAQQGGAGPVAGDFDGDGRGDVALTSGFTPPQVPWNTLPVAFSNGDGSFHTTNMFIGDFGTWATQTPAKAVAGDFDGDGKADIALTGGNSNGVPWNTLPVAFSNGDGSFHVTNTFIGVFGTYATQGAAKPVSGDFDGDGRTDIALTGGTSNGVPWTSVPVAFSNGDGSFRVTNVNLANFPTYATQGAPLVVGGDFDGDGRGDIALTGGVSNGVAWNTVPVAFSNGNGSFHVTNVAVGSFGTWATQGPPKAVGGDFDGDGKGDIALTAGSNSTIPWNSIPVAFSNGDGSFRITNANVADFPTWSTQGGAKVVGGY